MTTRREDTERFSLKRWSQRKLGATAKPATVSAPATPAGVEAAVTPPSAAGTPSAAAATQTAAVATAPVELPSIDSLTFESDFTAFLKPEVDPALQRAALKQLFRDPRFNVMDGLDTYIDDYTRPDPIPPDMLAELVQRFDFTSTPPQPAAPAADKESPESRAGASAPCLEAGASDRIADEPLPTPAGEISDAPTQSVVDGRTAASPETARESSVARDTGAGRTD